MTALPGRQCRSRLRTTPPPGTAGPETPHSPARAWPPKAFPMSIKNSNLCNVTMSATNRASCFDKAPHVGRSPPLTPLRFPNIRTANIVYRQRARSVSPGAHGPLSHSGQQARREAEMETTLSLFCWWWFCPQQCRRWKWNRTMALSRCPTRSCSSSRRLPMLPRAE